MRKVPGMSVSVMRRRKSRAVLAAVALAALGVAGQVGAGAGPAQARGAHQAARCDPGQAPQVTAAGPAVSYDTAFNSYGDTSGQWSGADSTYSTALPGDRELWSFSDTLVGAVDADGSRPADTPFVNNSFVITRHGQFRSVIGGTPSAPTSLVAPSDPNAWYWSGDPTVSGRNLEIPYLEFQRYGPGQWDWKWTGNVLARFDAQTLKLLGVTPLPSSANVEWGSYTFIDRGWTYVYGVEDLGSVKYLHIARVPGTDMRGDWQYWTGAGWSPQETDSARVMDGVGNEISVSRMGTGYVLISFDSNEFLGPHIYASFSCSPTGPFTAKTLIYTTPESGPDGSYGNGNVFTYNAHAHPELSQGDQLLISYNVNSFDVNDVFADASIYRPRFIVATFSGPGIPAHGRIAPITTRG